MSLVSNKTTPNSDADSHGKIFILAIITLVSVSLVFGALAIKEISSLRKQITTLENDRSLLISLLRKSKKEIHLLKNQIPATQAQMESAPAEKLKLNSPKFDSKSSYNLTFNNGSADIKSVSITFDGGSEANAAMEILDTLQSRNIKATMFLTGEFIRKFPDVVKEIALQGHELGNHTYKHPHLTTWALNRCQTTLPDINPIFIRNQLNENEKILQDKCNLQFRPLWRAPYGEFNETICRWALQSGYFHIGWGQGSSWNKSLDTHDWVPDKETPGYKTPSEVLSKILTLVRTNPNGINGGIILMHLGTERKEKCDQVHTVLGELIDSLQVQGYKIIPVTEMLQQSGISINSSVSGNFHSDLLLTNIR